VLAAGAALAAPASFQLARARAEFERGEYQRVVDTLAPELYPKLKITNTDELKDAHYLLGSAYFFLNRTELARQEFTALLFIDPARDLDPATDPPRVYAFYQTLKRELSDKLHELEQRKPAVEPAREVLIERTVHDPAPAITNFVPFGYGQFRNGQRGKGVFYLLSEGALAGTSVGIFTYQATKYGVPAHFPADQKSTFLTLEYLRLGSGALFLVLYGVGVYDAFANVPPLVEEKRSERPLGAPTAPAAPTPVDKPAPTSSVTIMPFIGPDGVGLGAMGSF
jgi:hypothetical protein